MISRDIVNITDIYNDGMTKISCQTKVTSARVFLHSVISVLVWVMTSNRNDCCGTLTCEFSAQAQLAALSFRDGLNLFMHAMAMMFGEATPPHLWAAIIALPDEKVKKSAAANAEGEVYVLA